MYFIKGFSLYTLLIQLILKSVSHVLAFSSFSCRTTSKDSASFLKNNNSKSLHQEYFPSYAVVLTSYFHRGKYSTTLFAKVGVFFGSSTGNTEHAADLITQEIGSDAQGPYDIDTIKGGISSEFMKYDALVVGTPTWNTGADRERSGTSWDEIYYGEMQEDLTISGKKVAVFGLGDQCSYAENYADASGELHDVFKNLGCRMIGYTSQEGYEHEDSKAIRGNKFCCLLLDEVNQEDMTGNRIKTWVAQLRDEGLFDNDSKNIVNLKLPVNSVKPGKLTSSEEEIISTLQRENINLRRLIDEKSRLLKIKNQDFFKKRDVNGYTPHLNQKTGRIMWTSPDGRTCYYTSNSDISVSE